MGDSRFFLFIAEEPCRTSFRFNHSQPIRGTHFLLVFLILGVSAMKSFFRCLSVIFGVEFFKILGRDKSRPYTRTRISLYPYFSRTSKKFFLFP